MAPKQIPEIISSLDIYPLETTAKQEEKKDLYVTTARDRVADIGNRGVVLLKGITLCHSSRLPRSLSPHRRQVWATSDIVHHHWQSFASVCAQYDMATCSLLIGNITSASSWIFLHYQKLQIWCVNEKSVNTCPHKVTPSSYLGVKCFLIIDVQDKSRSKIPLITRV